jgi:hypothetical protein
VQFERLVLLGKQSMDSKDFRRAVYNFEQALSIAPLAGDVEVWLLLRWALLLRTSRAVLHGRVTLR